MSDFTDNADMYVTKRNGKLEPVAFDKILQRIKKVGMEANIKINYTALTMKVIDQLYDKISTTKIDELTAEQCASMSSTHPDYSTLAGRITISNHHKNTDSSFTKVMTQLYQFKDIHGNPHPLISKELYQSLSAIGHKKLNGLCDYTRDYLIDYFGFKTLERAYLMKINKKIVERPQHMWLRVSLGIHGTNWDRVVETYEHMSNKYFTHATPTLFNAGTPKPQLSSCYLMAMEEDSIDGIFNTLKDCALISKWAGGIGLHIHNVRATGSHINGTNGTSNGIVPMLKVFNNTAKYVDQGGGKRNGSFAIYLEPWHADLEMFLQMRKNHGDEELKARDLFYALWVPDLFMERVKTNQPWTFMCPHECPGLSDVYGDEFKALYEKYEKENKGRKSVSSRDLWFQILDSQMETGTPYLLYKDASNQKSNQKNLGTIKSSNLCVSPETFVLTDEGQYPIYSLWPGNFPENQQDSYRTVNVWNGSEFSPVEVVKTGVDQELVEVSTSDGMSLKCTPYHKFYVVTDNGTITKEARELCKDDVLESAKYWPLINGLDKMEKDQAIELGIETGMNSLRIEENTSDHFNLFIPLNYSLQSKMNWLSGFMEPYVCEIDEKNEKQIEIPCKYLYFLQDLKLMLQTCGVNTVIRKELTQYTLIMTMVQIKHLMQNGLKFFNNYIKNCNLSYKEIESEDMNPIIKVNSVTNMKSKDDTYCFTEAKQHAGIFNGVRTSQCTEIIEYSDKDETAVCNLASIALPAFIETHDNQVQFNYSKLHNVTKIVTYNLNRIIDVNYYPTPKTRVSNMRHRPIGIGVQGLADVFLRFGLSFSEEKSKMMNKKIFETIYHASLEQSCDIAEQDGPYETFQGSPASQGILQFDMWKTEPINGRYDWKALKERIKTVGIRNSLLLAPMPTASTSQILGYNECIEPITSNIYTRRTIAGEFIMVNKYLMNELLDLGMWNETLKNHMIANNGSIQALEYIPQNIRLKYRTVWEIPMRELIDMSADRGAYICQSQSLNLWLEDPNYNTMTSMHFYSWSRGLKTGIYYLRRRPRHNAQQFTIEPEKRKTTESQSEEICEMCSA